MKTLRIFISSPSDVEEEREKARQVIFTLQRRYGEQVTLEPVFWEDLALPLTAPFQASIDLVLSVKDHIDIAVFIVWSRLGSPLGSSILRKDGSDYLSGTERELDLMLAAYEQSGGKSPLILAYTRQDSEGFNELLDARSQEDEDLEELLRQRRLVKRFIQEMFQDESGRNVRAYHTYREPVSFAQRLDVHLRDAIDSLLEVDSTAAIWKEAPYRSLAIFDVEHAPIFFGRDEEICNLLQRLRDQEKSGCAFVCIVGASGSGKSSLARAGVASTLMLRSYDEGVKEWRTVVFLASLAQEDLFLGLARALASCLPELAEGVGGLDRFATRLRERNFPATADLLDGALRAASAKIRGPLRILFLLDQMEELWTVRSVTVDDREEFLEALGALAGEGRLSVLATLRSDFYPQAQASEAFLRMKGEHGHFDLAAPGASALQQLIVQPSRRAGLAFERDDRTGRTLDQQIFEDAAGDPSALPLLQYALSELYEQRDTRKNCLTYAAYVAVGGVEGALAQRAAQVFEQLPDDAQAALDDLLPLVISIDVTGEQQAVRRRAPLTELTATPARRLLTERLIDARFITTDESEGTAIATLAHEALLRRWDRIAGWIHANRDLLRMRAQLEQSERRWDKSSRARSLLLPEGLPLEEGRRLLTEAPHLLTSVLADYVRSSIAKSLGRTIETGEGMLARSLEIEERHPEVWHEVVAQAFQSDLPSTRRHVAFLLSERTSPGFEEELQRLVLLDAEVSVRQAAAQSLVSRGAVSAYDGIRDSAGTVPNRGPKSGPGPGVRGALAHLLAASDMQARRPPFADWFARQESRLTRPVRLLSHWFRLKGSLPTFLFVLVPAAIFAVMGAGSVKWLPSAFNYSCVQATASPVMGLFHSAPSGVVLGGGVVFGLTLYRLVLGREYDTLSMLRPFPAIVFGAAFGLLAGVACLIMIVMVYQPEALQQMGWLSSPVRPSLAVMLPELIFRNRCGWAFPLPSIGLGIALALMTNNLRASRVWPEFVGRQSAISGVKQLVGVVRGITRVTLPFALPIPIFVPLFAFIAFVGMNTADSEQDRPPTPWETAWLGGLDQPLPADVADQASRREFEQAQIARRMQWKRSPPGRALGLLGDCLAMMIGGYFSIVGMGLGIVAMHHGVRIEPKNV